MKKGNKLYRRKNLFSVYMPFNTNTIYNLPCCTIAEKNK